MKLNYQQTLERIEEFLIDSGWRAFCTEVCKGRCCHGCGTWNPEACHKVEGRRLYCSMFTCFDFQRHVLGPAAKNLGFPRNCFNKVRELILKEIYRIDPRTLNGYAEKPLKAEVLKSLQVGPELLNKYLTKEYMVEISRMIAEGIKGAKSGLTDFLNEVQVIGVDFTDEQILSRLREYRLRYVFARYYEKECPDYGSYLSFFAWHEVRAIDRLIEKINGSRDVVEIKRLVNAVYQIIYPQGGSNQAFKNEEFSAEELVKVDTAQAA